MRGPSYLGLTRSISWLLMPWLLASPGHQQPWYWLCKISKSRSYMRKDFNYLWHVEEWHLSCIRLSHSDSALHSGGQPAVHTGPCGNHRQAATAIFQCLSVIFIDFLPRSLHMGVLVLQQLRWFGAIGLGAIFAIAAGRVFHEDQCELYESVLSFISVFCCKREGQTTSGPFY